MFRFVNTVEFVFSDNLELINLLLQVECYN
jgi:hypothetical protein